MPRGEAELALPPCRGHEQPVTTADRQLSDILSEFARTMLTDFPIQRILEELVRRIVELMEITGAGVTLISDTTSPHYVAASDGSALRFEELQTALDEGPCVEAYQSGEAVSIADLHTETRFPGFVAAALEAGLVAVFTFPLRQGDRRLGALDLYRNSPGLLSDDAMVVAQTLADVVSAYLVNAQARADLVDSSSRAHEVAVHDALTGLPNRSLLLERIEHALLARRRSEKHVAVLFIDLDGFKKVNDNFGHQLGDDLLVAVGEQITRLLRPGDTLARLAGDEFVIVCPDLDDEDQVEAIAERIVRALGQPFDLHGVVVAISASVGIAFAGSGNDSENLLHRADIAMYQVKRKGGARHQVIDADEQEHTDYSDSLKRDLGRAIRRLELRIDYQPVIDVTDGRVCGLEALLRWHHPERGLVAPAVLIPLAELSGDIIEIGRWVLQKACIDRHRWVNSVGDRELVMAVNVSAHQLMAAGFVEMIEGSIAITNTSAEHLCLEITESAFVQDAPRALVVLAQLKSLGVRIALDDFCTGHSSLSYLMEYPVDIIKVDQAFIAKLIESPASHAIVAKTIELAHLLGLLVVCEGIETPAQCAEIKDLGADFCQGFYLARPMSADMIDQIVNTQESAWTVAG
jgi:diguanylate cyclase (GGDEF)-like protein